MTEPTSPEFADDVDYERLYFYRHRRVQQGARDAVWGEIAPFVYRLMGEPERVLEPAGGRGEFINAIPARERWMVDTVGFPEARRDANVKLIIGDASRVELPDAYFDGVFVSNLLEHFTSQAEIARFLAKMRSATERGGRIVVMGPNFRYCARRYFDYADHTVALSHIAVEEHLYTAGYEIERVVPRFLPYSFSGVLPPSPVLTRIYIRFPPAWRLFGKQFLLVGRADD